MKPFPAALWLAKFIVSLVLLLVVIPTGLFYGGAYVIAKYKVWQRARENARIEAQTPLIEQQAEKIAQADKLACPSKEPDSSGAIDLSCGYRSEGENSCLAIPREIKCCDYGIDVKRRLVDEYQAKGCKP
jgi:hypothetical protein